MPHVDTRRPARYRHTVSALLAGMVSCSLGMMGTAAAQRGIGPGEQLPAPRDRPEAQAPAAGTASVAGVVLAAETGTPARGARVTLSPVQGARPRSTSTDDQGRFAFLALAPGRYSLSATKAGHVGTSYGAARPGRPGTPIALSDGQTFSATLSLPRASVITGTVLDEHGEAAPGTQVRVLRQVLRGGRRTLQQAGGDATDDRGIYRVYGLEPGDYIVSASARRQNGGGDVDRLRAELQAVQERLAASGGNAAAGLSDRAAVLQGELAAEDGQVTGYAPIYYPGTAVASEAAPITLGVGEERASVDFGLQRVPMARVEGTIASAAGSAAGGAQVMLVDGAQAGSGLRPASTRADGEGRFRFASVPPGQYRLLIRAVAGEAGRGGAMPRTGGRGGRPVPPVPLWGSLDVAVDGRDVSGLVVPLQQGTTVSGAVTFDGTASPPSDPTRIRINLVPVEPAFPGFTQQAAGAVDPGGRFTVPSVLPGEYRITASGAGPGWSLASAVVDGQDSLDVPLEVRPGVPVTGAVVTFSDRQAQLTGTIVNGRGGPASDQTLILYPADERLWMPLSRRIRTTRPSTDGRFTFASLPPGEYKLVALVDVEPDAASDPLFLQHVDAASTRITIRDGETKVQNLKVSDGS